MTGQPFDRSWTVDAVMATYRATMPAPGTSAHQALLGWVAYAATPDLLALLHTDVLSAEVHYAVIRSLPRSVLDEATVLARAIAIGVSAVRDRGDVALGPHARAVVRAASAALRHSIWGPETLRIARDAVRELRSADTPQHRDAVQELARALLLCLESMRTFGGSPKRVQPALQLLGELPGVTPEQAWEALSGAERWIASAPPNLMQPPGQVARRRCAAATALADAIDPLVACVLSNPATRVTALDCIFDAGTPLGVGEVWARTRAARNDASLQWCAAEHGTLRQRLAPWFLHVAKTRDDFAQQWTNLVARDPAFAAKLAAEESGRMPFLTPADLAPLLADEDEAVRLSALRGLVPPDVGEAAPAASTTSPRRAPRAP